MTGDRLRCNRTSHCALCAVLAPGTLNLSRVFVGAEIADDRAAGVFAVCPVHDVAGPAAALPASIRRAVTP